MREEDVEDIEIALFVEAMLRRHGYDFRNYARRSFRRRVLNLAISAQCGVSELIPRLMRDEAFAAEAVSRLTVPVSEMFRDPPFFKAVRERVMPVLRSYPRINIWQAGCATGEEAFSLAILLKEEGLLDRSQVYATDINDRVLQRAEQGILSAANLGLYRDNYRLAGGRAALDDHGVLDGGEFRMRPDLRERVFFAHHNLVTDGVFCEFQAIFCRNVLIYFDQNLQSRVLDLFKASLARGGFLCLGTREAIRPGSPIPRFEAFDPALKIFRGARAHYDGEAMSLGVARQ